MHAGNGNIDRPYQGAEDRTSLFREDKDDFWHSEVIPCDPWRNSTLSHRNAMQHYTLLYYCRENHRSQAFTNAGTLYQFLATSDELKSRIKSKNRNFVNLMQRLMWIGVGSDDCRLPIKLCHSQDVNNARSVVAAVSQSLTCQQVDYRQLAMKIDLYDELRDSRFLQPSGVEYGWASPGGIESEIVTLNKIDEWHYEAIFVTLEVIEECLATDCKVNVGTIRWDIQSPDVKIIGLRPDAETLGLETWVISHLTYPLALVLDKFNMSVVGRNGARDEVFVRTASLVDMHNPGNKIIFVVDNISSPFIKLGHDFFNVCNTNSNFSSNDAQIQVYNMDKTIEIMVYNMLTSQTSLREAFSRYCEPYFISEIDWIGINSLTILLTVRWHQRIESYVVNSDDRQLVKRSIGAPLNVLKEMGLYADSSIDNDAYPGYGGDATVNGLDQRFVDKSLARIHPAIKLGSWNNMAEIGLISAYNRYDIESAARCEEVSSRVKSGGQDRVMRGQILRRAFELWKRTAGQSDRIAFPSNEPAAIQYWPVLVYGVKGRTRMGVNCIWFANEFVTSFVTWNWTMNILADDSNGSTMTGIRTVSSWWRSTQNCEWTKFDISRDGRPGKSEYVKDSRIMMWSYGMYYQEGDGEDDPELESVLMRIDLERFVDLNWGFRYRTHPVMDSEGTLVWVVDSSYGGILARMLGWGIDGTTHPKKDVWGWGLFVRLKDYRIEQLKSLVIPSKTVDIFSRDCFSEGTILYYGSSKVDTANITKMTNSEFGIRRMNLSI